MLFNKNIEHDGEIYGKGYSDVLLGRNSSKRKKKSFSFPNLFKKFSVKKVFGGLALVAVIAAFVGGYDLINNVGSLFKGFRKENIDPDDLLAFSETIPLDQDGVISITYPFANRTYDEVNGRYSLPDSYDFVYIKDSENAEPELQIIKKGEMEPANIVDFESTTGYPVGVIGVRSDYANFLNEAGEVKEIALSEDNPNNDKLVEEKYEVSNVYSLPEGYQLYCEDEEILKQALLAYIAEDGTQVFIIPENIKDMFVVVTDNEFIIIDKFNIFRDQISEVYDLYESNRLNDGTQGNRGR